MLRQIVVLIGIVIGMGGCISTSSVLIDPTGKRYPPVDPESVLILLDPSDLDRYVHERVAIILATGSSMWSTQAQMYEYMRKEAASKGANAVLLPSLDGAIDEPSAGAQVAGTIFGVDPSRKGQVIAYRLTYDKQENRVIPILPYGGSARGPEPRERATFHETLKIPTVTPQMRRQNVKDSRLARIIFGSLLIWGGIDGLKTYGSEEASLYVPWLVGGIITVTIE